MWKALKNRLSYTAEEFEEPMLNAGFKVQITKEVRMIRMTRENGTTNSVIESSAFSTTSQTKR